MATATVGSEKVVFIRGVSEDLWKQAKSAAALEGTTLSEFVQRAIREALKKARSK
jgi:uncharacterized protein (DUF1778 family)